MTPSAALVAALLAVDPQAFGGALVRSAAGDERDRWLSRLAALLPSGTPWRRVPLHADDDRLLGGLDLPATLRAGRPVAQRGLLAEADGGIVVLPMAERLRAATAAHVATALDTGEVVVERHGIGTHATSRIAVLALDEGRDDDERAPARLYERLAFHLTLAPAPRGERVDGEPTDEAVRGARRCFAAVGIDDRFVEGLCATAAALGVDSARASVYAVRAARAVAALHGRDRVDADDAALAAALVLAPRATRAPARENAAGAAAPGDAVDGRGDDAQGRDAENVAEGSRKRERDSAGNGRADAPTTASANYSIGPAAADREASVRQAGRSDPLLAPSTTPPSNARADADATNDRVSRLADGPLDERILEAALAALPRGLLATLALGAPSRAGAASSGTAGAARKSTRRGRPLGARRGEPRAGARLSLVDTLRAAAPWQPLRRREAAERGDGAVAPLPEDHAPAPRPPAPVAPASCAAPRVLVRREDFHVMHHRQRSETTTVFVVDASGSSALHRLAEAKGAVESLLADCYVRRDSVAVIAFRGSGAEVLLPPTRSLVRAKRSLAGLPGGGGTPLASGIASAHALATAVRRRGATPIVVLLTDGRANVARDGTPGRAGAAADAAAAARALRADGVAALLLDTSPQPQPAARELAIAMGGRYVPLPHADATLLSQAVRLASPTS